MKTEELEFEKTLDYIELCNYLQKKYDAPKFSYFLSIDSKNPTSRIRRSDEGLFVHHIYENTMPDLGKNEVMKITPFEWQQPENLLYCNYLEHFLLHLKIVKEGKSIKRVKILGIGGIINHFCEALNYYYLHHTSFRKNTWLHAWAIVGKERAKKYEKMIETKDKQFEPIKENVDDYLLLLKETDEAICSDEIIFDYCKDIWKQLFREELYGKYTTNIYKMFVEKFNIPKIEIMFKNK